MYSFIDESGETRLVGFISPAPGGGSHPPTRVLLAFNTPNILTGAPFYTPAAGQVMPPYGAGGVFITTAWNGTTPFLHLGVSGALDLYDESLLGSSGGLDLTLAATAIGTDALLAGVYWNSNNAVKFLTATPILASVDDGNGGNPGASQGACEIVFVVIPAS